MTTDEILFLVFAVVVALVISAPIIYAIKKEEIMKGNCGECERRWFCEIDPDKCNEWPDPVPQTSAEHIRSMTDEVMATDLLPLFEELCEDGIPSPEYMRLWLKQPYKEESHE